MSGFDVSPRRKSSVPAKQISDQSVDLAFIKMHFAPVKMFKVYNKTRSASVV